LALVKFPNEGYKRPKLMRHWKQGILSCSCVHGIIMPNTFVNCHFCLMKCAPGYICQCSLEVTGLISSIQCSLSLPPWHLQDPPPSVKSRSAAEARQLNWQSACLSTQLKITQLINIHIHLAEGDTRCLTNRSRTPIHTRIGTPQVLCTRANTNTWMHTRACML